MSEEPLYSLLGVFGATPRSSDADSAIGLTLARSLAHCCRANMAQIGQSRPDSGLGFQATVLDRLRVVWLKRLGGGHTRQEDVEVSPTKSRVSPSIHRILRPNV